MLKIVQTLLIIGIVFCQWSCKDYLDLKSDNTLLVPTSLNDFQALLNNPVNMNNGTTPSLVEDWADDYFALASRVELFDVQIQNRYVWEIDQLLYPNDWSTCYRPIYYANFCLEGLPKIEKTDINKAQYDRIKGTALFFRAYFYLKLLWTFSPAYDEATSTTDLGIVLKEDTDFNTRSVRSSVEEGYQKMLKDAQDALALLPVLSDIPTQPSKVAAHALLARAYLSMRKYDKALFHADETLKISDDLMDYNKPEDGVETTATIPLQKYNKETIFYSEMNSYQSIFFMSSNGGRIDTVLYANFGENDLRRQFYFVKSGDYYQNRGIYTGANFRYFSGLAFDEVYLIRAECKARLNDMEGAMEDLNHLLQYRYDNKVAFLRKVAFDSKEALEIILLERRKSLIFRGLRLVDIKRLNKEGYNISIKRFLGDKEYNLLPNDSRIVFRLPDDLKPFVD
ncbi:RagB/SusD family nutrient uptake outer membrane protein [Sphingobacterium sp. UT-1RO-CII-1]|uniref:RagB/SusD family nutrient uptake outer membrane protein n=1 Tax=Sphingobacterium sp. UT-1RO-CII-1 TaxID=2995225 RepID=UPI00227A23A1|nr:RagB/SusD family nutrient uptake outer membrane protein [Sphingobacterium sp. UT-1RO-CII-1]MCY4778817.1 RagB/SusD family nutrient uptake outer membrane protein [Sphingobacterium sp. UT-1RO-CII-1]